MENYWNQIVQSVTDFSPQIMGAVAILLVGWIIAVIASRIVRGVLRKTGINNTAGSWLTESGEENPDIASVAGRVVFWLLMTFTIVGFMQVLGLTMAVEPLNGLLERILGFLPQFVGALVLVMVAWGVATVVRIVVTRVLATTQIDKKVAQSEDGTEGKPVPVTRSLGEAAYWLVFLLFLPAVLEALSLEGLLLPVQETLNKVMNFLPNIVAAAVILLVGWFVARIVKQLVTSLLAAAGLDRLGAKVGLKSLSGLVGIIVYIAILIPVLLAALQTLALDAITAPVSNMLNVALGALPMIFAAALVLAVTYAIGRLLAGLVTDLLTGLGFNSLPVRLGLAKEVSNTGTTPAQVTGYLLLATFMLMGAFEAASLLGFTALSSLLAELTVFGGHILMGCIILVVGMFLANLAGRAISASGSAQSGAMATIVRVAIIALSGSIAIRHMGLANEIINLAFGLILGAVAVAAAIAFGIGGRGYAARKLDEWSGQKKDH